LVCAEEQTGGRGRFDRSWTAERGANLTFSLILYPELPLNRLGLITIAFSVAVAQTIRHVAPPEAVDLKWPNDVLVHGLKICGMLQESTVSQAGRLRRVIVGIGLNVNQTDFPDAIRETATSLRLVTGRSHDRVRLLSRLLLAMEAHYDAVLSGREATVRSLYEANLNSIGRRVRYVRPSDGRVGEGIVTGIEEQGGLVVSTRSGPETIFAGDVSLSTSSEPPTIQ
jgi:BirA family biotin operon repressor/biotin-[acetyl-CoA-carboxylase] ligase